MPNQKQCKNCTQPFVIDERDRAFYQKMEVPEPTWCPPCRRLRRLMFVNAYYLYPRTCALTGKEILSVYHPNSPYVVYSNEAYWSDQWNHYEYGRDFDFGRPFFEQLHELNTVVPIQTFDAGIETMVNSNFCNMCGHLKDCYLVFHADFNEGCMYCVKCNRSRDLVDCEGTDSSELCFQCTRCEKCYHSLFCLQCISCIDCLFCFDCTNCQNCFGCANLKNKKYCVYNEQKSKEEYERFIASLPLGSRSGLKKIQAEVEAKTAGRAVRFYFGVKNEDVSGNYIYNSKDAHDCFDVRGIEHGRYVDHFTMPPGKDVYDFHIWGNNVERCYEVIGSGEGIYNLKFCLMCWPACSNLEYCIRCHSSNECFASVGVKKGKHVIFNKPYDARSYEQLKLRIIAHMKETGEYGEFFPVWMSPCAYNESEAGIEYEPRAKEEVLKKGWRWEENVAGTFGKETMPQSRVPDRIEEVSDDLAREILACVQCGRNYKVIKQEIAFYKKMNVPVPELCMLCRFQEHFQKTCLRKLYDRQCSHCGAAVQTVYAPERPERLFCEECYRKEFA